VLELFVFIRKNKRSHRVNNILRNLPIDKLQIFLNALLISQLINAYQIKYHWYRLCIAPL